MTNYFSRIGWTLTCCATRLAGAIGAAVLPALALAQVSVSTPGVRVSSDDQGNVAVSIGKGNTAVNSAGGIGTDVEMEGVAVINGEVFIDGEKVPRGKVRHTGKKSGAKYRINWSKDGNVAVTQE